MICFLVSLITLMFYFVFKTRETLKTFQSKKEYFIWIKKNLKDVFLSYDLIYLILFILGFFLNMIVLEMISVVLGVILTLLYLKKKDLDGKHYKYTKKTKNLRLTFYLIYLISLLFICFNYEEEYIMYYYLVIGLLVYLNYIIVFIADYVNKLIELLIIKLKELGKKMSKVRRKL